MTDHGVERLLSRPRPSGVHPRRLGSNGRVGIVVVHIVLCHRFGLVPDRPAPRRTPCLRRRLHGARVAAGPVGSLPPKDPVVPLNACLPAGDRPAPDRVRAE